MTNAFDFSCPGCGDTDHLDIQARVWLRMTEDGTDPDHADNGDHEWDTESPFTCTACGEVGTVAALEANRVIRSGAAAPISCLVCVD